MDLSLVLPCPGGFDGPPFPGESHIPALILGILEGCVIVLQDYLCEDTVPAPAVGLCQETGKGSYVRSRHMDRGVLSDSFMHTSNTTLLYQTAVLPLYRLHTALRNDSTLQALSKVSKPFLPRLSKPSSQHLICYYKCKCDIYKVSSYPQQTIYTDTLCYYTVHRTFLLMLANLQSKGLT